MDDTEAASSGAVAGAGTWHGTRLAAFLQDGGRVAVVASDSAAVRAAVLETALKVVGWPVVTAGNPLSSPLTLYRLLIQVGAEDDGGDEADSLVRFLASHSETSRPAGPEPWALVVNDAHTLTEDVLLALTRVLRWDRDRVPGLTLILAGDPALKTVLSHPAVAALSDASDTLILDVPAARSEPVRGTLVAQTSSPAAPAVPMPPARAAQVVEPPRPDGIVQIPLPPQRPSVVADPPPARPPVQVPMPPMATPAKPPIEPPANPLIEPPAMLPGEPPAAVSPIWARPSEEPPPNYAAEPRHQPYLARISASAQPVSPAAARPAVPVTAAELISAPTPIDTHILGIRSQIGEDRNREGAVHRIWVSVAATLVAAAAGAAAMLVWRTHAVAPRPTVTIPAPAPAPATVPQPRPPPHSPASITPPSAAPAAPPTPMPTKPPPATAPSATRPVPRAAPPAARPAEQQHRPASADDTKLY